MMSALSFANTNEVKEINLIETNKTALTDSKELIEDEFWFCYETGRTSDYNFMSGETTVTVYYRCTWYAL